MNKPDLSNISTEELADELTRRRSGGFKWVAFSQDRSWRDESIETYQDKDDAYLEMRSAALGKMEWNTELEDFDDTDAIRYEVWFSPEIIAHESYSGVYVYRIVPAKDAQDIDEDAFFKDKDVIAFLKEHDLRFHE